MKYTEILEQLVNEINMSPTSLKQLSQGIDALAGMEFEMIVPNVGSLDDYEQEPDYETDERARSISDITEFFNDGDFNSRREIQRLEESLNEAYQEWKWDQLSDKWADEGYEFFVQYIEEQDVFDRDEALDTARDEFIDANPDIPVDSEEAQRGISARVDELEQEFIQEMWDDRGRYYDNAQEMFNDDHSEDLDESDWLRSEGYSFMSDIQNNFDIQWPHWTSGGGEGNIDEVANDFEKAIGKSVNAASDYHAARREPGKYVVEPDGSLEGDNPGDQGLEFVSPPMPISELISDLNTVKKWAGEYGCYTNESTGLHINVSVPGFSLEKLDYVKLALLLGDEYVLKEFGRSSNTYCKSALKIVKDNIRSRPDDVKALLDKMKEHLSTAAAKVIHSGTTNKYTSINTKTGYIEFRSPGADWLDENFDKIENTLLRFVVALDASLDETKYKEEYAKKLYKLLAPSTNEPSILQLFANYSAGELDKEALIRQVRSAQLGRNLAKGKIPAGQKYWWNVAIDGQRIEVVASNKDEAWNKATDENQEWMRFNINQAAITPLRPYFEPAQDGQQGNWGFWITSVDRFARAPGQTDNNVLRRFNSREEAEHFRANTPGIRSDIEIREIEPTNRLQIGSATSQTDMENRMGLPDQTGDANWEIIDRRTGRRVFVMIANTEYDARRKYADWLSASRIPIETDDYGFREIGTAASAQPDQFRSTENVPREGRPNNLTPRGPGPWEIYRISNGESIRVLDQTNRNGAETEARTALGLRGEAPELYGVRTRQAARAANYRGPWEIFRIEDGRTMGTIESGNYAEAEVAMERRARDAGYDPDVLDIRPAQQTAAQAGDIVAPGLGEPTTPQTLTTPGQPQQRFTGEWDVRMGGQVVFRVRGENQGIANNAARQWILGRSAEFLRDHQGEEVEVVPRYE